MVCILGAEIGGGVYAYVNSSNVQEALENEGKNYLSSKFKKDGKSAPDALWISVMTNVCDIDIALHIL